MNLVEQSGAYFLENGGTDWAELSLPLLGGNAPTVATETLTDSWLRVRFTWQLDAPLQQDELAAALRLRVEPNFWWAHHLAPNPGDCMAQHAFRSPALIVSTQTESATHHFILVPDLDICGQESEHPWFLDIDAPARTLYIGLSQTDVPEHVRFRKIPGMSFAPGRVELGFFVAVDHQEGYQKSHQAGRNGDNPPNPFAKVSRFLWARYAQPLLAQGQPIDQRLDPYVKHVYNWAFNTWKEAVWQEFEIDGKRVGAPAFIVNVTQSPNYPGEQNLREILSVWNQAWFSSLRSAAGLYRYVKQSGDETYLPQALMTKEFALAAPMRDGIFPAVYRTQMTQVEIDGRRYTRSLGWQTAYWSNSNRTPKERGIDDRWYHILDASWTTLNMVRWYQELEQDPRLLDYANRYADKLLTLQDREGFFPAWLHPDSLTPSHMLAQSPETSLSVTFLLALAEATGEPRYQAAALAAMEAVITHIIGEGRWEDFETYWSCCQWGKWEYYGKRVTRNGLYKQCNFSIFWTAEALLACYRLTQEERYLRWGRRTLDELGMTQQVWQPPYIYIPALGGFGVMNFDGEWNDSRQCLFAELFMDYYRATGEAELFERGIVALKAAFVMMYCPENPTARALWEQVWPFFGPEDYGFTMENYGHSGRTSAQGEGIGEFTIYDWGNGAAAEAFNRIRDHYGDLYLDAGRGRAFAINGLTVTPGAGGQFTIQNPGDSARDLRIVTDSGESRRLHLAAQGQAVIGANAAIG
jgi:hypothetical protein